MKRITPVVLLALTPSLAWQSPSVSAQSSNRDLAPGPIAEVLPEKDLFDTLGVRHSSNNQSTVPSLDRTGPSVFNANPLPSSAGSGLRAPSNSIGGSSGSGTRDGGLGASSRQSISSPAPVVPSRSNWSAPRTPVNTKFMPPSVPENVYRNDAGASVQSPLQNTAESSIPQEQIVTHSPPVDSPRVITGTSESCACEVDGVDFELHSDITVDSSCGCADCGSDDGFLYTDGGCSECDTVYEESTPDSGRRKSHLHRHNRHKGILGRHRAKHAQKKARRHKAQPKIVADDYYYEEFVDDDSVYFEPDNEEYDVVYDHGNLVGGVSDQDSAVDPIDYGQDSQKSVNTIIGLSGLYFTRNYGDDLLLSQSQFPGERGLFANDADHDEFGGFDVNLTRRKANGHGFEARYFAFEPSRVSRSLGGSPVTALDGTSFFPSSGLAGIGTGIVGLAGTFSAADIFNAASVHQVTRDTEIRNVEFNILRLGRVGQRKKNGRAISHEYLLGFRYFEFNESVDYSARAFPTNSVITQANYQNEVSNSLYGIQVGGRSEIGLLRRLSLIVGTKAGVFSNDVSNDQTVNFTQRGAPTVTATPIDPSGANLPFSASRNDITLLGELDLGLTYQVTDNSRLRVGYRAVYVPDVAFATAQTDILFAQPQFGDRPDSDDDLILHGGYLGLEVAF